MTKPETEWVLAQKTSLELWRDYFKAEASKVRSPVQCVEAGHAKSITAMLSAAPLAPSTPDAGVVKEWEERRPWPEYGTVADWLVATTTIGDRLAASHTEQAKALSDEKAACQNLLTRLQNTQRRAEAAEAEVERLTKCGAPDVGVACDAADKAGLPGVSRMLRALLGKWLRTDDRATKAEADVERLTREAENAEAWADNLKLQLASAKGWEKRNLEAAATAEAERDTAQATAKAAEAREVALVVALQFTSERLSSWMSYAENSPAFEPDEYEIDGRALDAADKAIAATPAQALSRYEAMRKVCEAAENIRHWHDACFNKSTGETEGMIVSASHVRELWGASAKLAALPLPALPKTKGEGT